MPAETNPGVTRTIEPQTGIEKKALVPWETVDGMLELRTHNNPVNSALNKRYPGRLKEYYDFLSRRARGLNEGEATPLLPRAGLAYHFRIVRETFYQKPEKFSHGARINRRREKTRQRKEAQDAEMASRNAPIVAAARAREQQVLLELERTRPARLAQHRRESWHDYS